MRRFFKTVRNIVIVGFVVAAGLRLALGGMGGDCGTLLCCEDCAALAVNRVIDGDTIHSERGRVRLYGVDTPEPGERCSVEATQRLRELSRKSVRVEPGPRSHDPFGRLLYYVYTRAGESIDELLLKEGLGVAWTRDGQHAAILTELQRKAEAGHVGCLWSTG